MRNEVEWRGRHNDEFEGGFKPGEVKYFTDNSEAVKGAWIVIEAVPERIAPPAADLA